MDSFKAFLEPLTLANAFCCASGGGDGVLRQEQSPRTSSSFPKEGSSTTNIIAHGVIPPQHQPSMKTTLSPSQYAEMLRSKVHHHDQPPPAPAGGGEVTVVFDLPRFAGQCAAALDPHCFTCAHVVAALAVTPAWDRAALVRSVLVYCDDLEMQHTTIQDQLSEWEQSVTGRAFRKALEDKKQQQQRQRSSAWFSS
jgi:hypothetical protein